MHRNPNRVAKVASRVGACISTLLFVVASVSYMGSWNDEFVAAVQPFDGVLLGAVVCLSFFTGWHQWKTASEAERSTWHSSGSDASVSSWMEYVSPLLVIFFVAHMLYLHAIAPRGFVVFRGGKFNDRSVSEFVNNLPHHAYSRLLAADHRTFASFYLTTATYMLVYWWLGRGRLVPKSH